MRLDGFSVEERGRRPTEGRTTVRPFCFMRYLLYCMIRTTVWVFGSTITRWLLTIA